MSELEQSATGSPLGDAAAQNEDLVGLLGDQPAEREGLPRGYRMRADAHYVDQLDSRHGAPAIRLIPTRQIEAADLSPSVSLTALAQSISAHGILQPLLVRRHGGRYQVIAGRKRLAAAVAAGVADVPCLAYDVDEAEAAALAGADNLRAVSQDQVQSPAETDCLHQALQALSYDLAGMGSLIALLRPSGATVFQHRVAADLLQAQAWRAAWLARAASIVTGPCHPSRARPVGSIVERVRTGFEAEARLTRLQLDCSVTPEAARFIFDEDLAISAATGCVFATLSWLQGADGPRVEVRADATNPRTLRLEVVQRIAPMPKDVARYLEAAGLSRPGDLVTTLGLLTVKSFAEHYRGTVEFRAIGDRGSLIQATCCRPDEN